MENLTKIIQWFESRDLSCAGSSGFRQEHLLAVVDLLLIMVAHRVNVLDQVVVVLGMNHVWIVDWHVVVIVHHVVVALNQVGVVIDQLVGVVDPAVVGQDQMICATWMMMMVHWKLVVVVLVFQVLALVLKVLLMWQVSFVMI